MLDAKDKGGEIVTQVCTTWATEAFIEVLAKTKRSRKLQHEQKCESAKRIIFIAISNFIINNKIAAIIINIIAVFTATATKCATISILNEKFPHSMDAQRIRKHRKITIKCNKPKQKRHKIGQRKKNKQN